MITAIQRQRLTQLAASDVGGFVDSRGGVLIDGEVIPRRRAAVTWLLLVASGLVAGADGYLVATKAGRDFLANTQRRRAG